MAIKKIPLDITPAVEAYATEYGAFDDEKIGWYCLEPVPIELEDFVSESAKLKKLPSFKQVQCPKCGGQMHIRSTRRGSIFWSCMSYPRCLGSCSVDETDEFNFKRVLKATPEMDNNLVINPNQDYKKLLELGLRKLGGQKAFYDWMSKAKVALDGKRPIDVICYNEGYSNVMDLLGKFNQ